MLFVMTLTAAAGLALFNGNRLVAQAAGSDALVQLPGGAGESDALAAAIAAAPGVAAATAIPQADVRASLETWMGPAARTADLPLPALVEVRMEPDAAPDRIAAALAEDFPAAQVVPRRTALGPLLAALRTVALFGLLLVLAIAAAAAAAIAIVTRAALAADRGTVATLHGMGATDAQVASGFLGAILRDALVGGAIGTALALAMLWAGIALGGSESLSLLVGGARLLGPIDLVMLLALPLLAAAMAYVVARATILRDLRSAL